MVQPCISHFPLICRFCLMKTSKSDDLRKISDVPSIDIFRVLTGIENNDDLPQKICIVCIQTFQSFSTFVETSKQNIERLKTLCEKVNNDENQCEEFENETLIPKNNSKPRTLTCKNCKAVFDNKSEIKLHSAQCVKCTPIDYKCLECNKVFKKLPRLKVHERSHTQEAPYKCTQCDKTFRFQQNLKRHLLIHRGVKKFKCEECGKTFSRLHVLNDHKNIHTGHNPYICNYCGKGFKRYANHFIHVHRHKLLNGEIKDTEDQKLYLQIQCKICKKIFASRGGLENHLILHQKEPKEKRFLCTYCGKGFNTNSQLVSHRRTHTDQRPFECCLCEKKFKQKSAYNNHQLMHTGEKSHQCTICQRLFGQSAHLKVHMRVHSGEKPFNCSFCEKKFALRSNLKVHTRTHTGEKPYVCPLCDKSYYDSTGLKKHMKTHNSKEASNSDVK
ncbi:unnamed protein product [Ceutorhynchus assimilis]|uniref:C2H2-type domain-containing protein n=1 Tax=Ceutorhynchus assimilis TaxID=467358 RepID=A0A9N9MRT8_9CUCU|nr:unnamed protein product [Ceutorhynchus assimilis]